MFVFVRPGVHKMIHSRCVLFEYLLKHSLLCLAPHTYQIYIYKCLKSLTVHRNKTRSKHTGIAQHKSMVTSTNMEKTNIKYNTNVMEYVHIKIGNIIKYK